MRPSRSDRRTIRHSERSEEFQDTSVNAPQDDRSTKSRFLQRRFCDLQLSLNAPLLRSCIQQLYDELDQAGFEYFKPQVYLSTEWFSPENSLLIAAPFYLADARLMRLEKRLIGYAEGESPEWCMRLLRHEAGHCFDHAFQLSSKSRWRAIFGSPDTPYDPDYYSFDTSSKDFVINLDDHYAQSHPDEDFAETFAVWLDPDSNWQTTYRDWKLALKKLQYVNELADKHRNQKPCIKKGRPLADVRNLRSRLGSFYQKRFTQRHIFCEGLSHH